MKRFLTVIFLLSITITGWSQATQPCIVKQYNQKQPKTPLAGVEVVIRDAGTNTSNEQGTLVLKFNTQKPGDKVVCREISKPGYVLFNTDAINQWIIARNGLSFEIVMVKSDYFEQLKGRLTKVSKESYETKYQQALRELKLEKERSKMKEEDYQKKILELEDKHYEDLKNLNNYIDQFARIDMSEVSIEEQRILELVEAGKIEKAIQSYDKLELNKKLTSEITDYLELEKVVKSAEELRSQKRENIDALYASINRYVSTMVLADKFREAIEVLASAMNDFSKLCDKDQEANRPKLADLQLQLGEILVKYQWGGEKEASAYLTSALTNYMFLYENHPDRYYKSVANAKILLGKCKIYELDYEGAESLYLDALSIWKQRTEQDSLQYIRDIASTEHQLGQLYEQWISKRDQAEKYYLSALDYYTILLPKDPEGILPVVADLKLEVGRYYDKMINVEKAELFYLDAQKEYVSLAEKNSEYLHVLEKAQNDLALFYLKRWSVFKKEDDFTNAETSLKAACQTALAQNDNEFRFRSSSINWSSLAELYIDRNDFQKAETCITEYNEVYKERYPDDKNGFNLSSQMGDLYLNKGYPERAIPFYQDAINQSKGVNEESLVWHYMDMSLCYYLLGDSTKTEESMEAAFKLLDDEDKKNGSSPLFFSVINLSKEVFSLKEYVVMLSYQQRQENDLNMSAFDLRFLEHYTQLLMRNHSHDYEELAQAQKDLGKSFEEAGNSDRAEHYYVASLENFEHLKKEQQEAFSRHADMAETQSNLARLYFYNIEDDKKAEEFFLQSLTYYILAEDYQQRDTCSTFPLISDSYDRNKYKAKLSYNQRQLGYLYFFKEDYEKADSFLCQAYNNYELYYKTHPNIEFTWENRTTLAEMYYFETISQQYLSSSKDNYDGWLKFTTNCYEELYEKFPDKNLYKTRLSYLIYCQAKRQSEVGNADESMKLLARCQEVGGISDERLSSGYNSASYAYARDKNFKKALETIDKAISLRPEEANYYDSKGEILLMKGDEKGAVKMWQKVIELDPEFLQKYEGGTDLYKQLKERGLLE